MSDVQWYPMILIQCTIALSIIISSHVSPTLDAYLSLLYVGSFSCARNHTDTYHLILCNLKVLPVLKTLVLVILIILTYENQAMPL